MMARDPERRRAAQQKYRERNREKIRANAKRFRAAHLEDERARDREYRRTHQRERRAANKAWGERNPDKVRAIQRRSYDHHAEQRRAYARAHWPSYYHKNRERILAKQYKAPTGPCPTCGIIGKLFRDHDHTTGANRGLLCRACNLILGFSDDNPARLRALADYLEV